MDGMRPAHRLRGCFRQTEVTDFALPDQVRHRAHRVVDRDRPIHAMLIVEIDVIHAQPPERGVACRLDVLRAAVLSGPLPVRSADIPELRREDYLVATS